MPKVYKLISEEENIQKLLNFAIKNNFLIEISPKNQSIDRIIAKKGTNFKVIFFNEVAYFFTESKVVFLVDTNGEKYIIEPNLSELENKLPHNEFFRVNRKFIVHVQAIKSFKPSFKGKIALELLHLSKAEVSISQENASDFKNWLEQI